MSERFAITVDSPETPKSLWLWRLDYVGMKAISGQAPTLAEALAQAEVRIYAILMNRSSVLGKCQCFTARSRQHPIADLPCGNKARHRMPDGTLLCGTHQLMLTRRQQRAQGAR